MTGRKSSCLFVPFSVSVASSGFFAELRIGAAQEIGCFHSIVYAVYGLSLDLTGQTSRTCVLVGHKAEVQIGNVCSILATIVFVHLIRSLRQSSGVAVILTKAVWIAVVKAVRHVTGFSRVYGWIEAICDAQAKTIQADSSTGE